MRRIDITSSLCSLIVASKAPSAAFALVALGALAGPAHGAQALSGSESGIAIAQGSVSAGGGSRNSASLYLEATSGQAASGPVATSESYEVHEGIVWVVPKLESSAPIVMGVAGSGEPDSGESDVSVFGFNFTAPGAGAADVSFGGSFGGNTTVHSNTVISTTVPPGVNEFGNPLGEVSVEVSNALGSYLKPGGHIYKPALVQASLAKVGAKLQLHFLTDPGSILFLAIGESNGAALPVAPLAGALELSKIMLTPVEGEFTPAGAELVTFPVPNEPALAGLGIEFQGLALSNNFLLTGSFTNRLAVAFLP